MNWQRTIGLIGVLLIGQFAAAGAGSAAATVLPPSVTAVGVALPEDSLHVTDHTPEIAWAYHDEQGLPLAATEVEVGYNPDWTVAEMWQSPTIYGDDTAVVYAGEPLLNGYTYYLRVRVSNGSLWSDWYETRFRMNVAPTMSWPVAPDSGALAGACWLKLAVTPATDPQPGDTVRYDFEIYADADLTVLVEAHYNILSQGDPVPSPSFVNLEREMVYWWRTRATDTYEASTWSHVWQFHTPGTPILVPTVATSIQEAINLACAGDSVLVNPGLYTENLDLRGKRIAVVGRDGPSATTITPADPAEPTVRMIYAEPEETELAGFTLAGGEGVAMVYVVNGSAPTIHHNIFRDFNSTQANGAAVLSVQSQPTITDNLFIDNTCFGCVGVLSGSATIAHNTIDGNTGGIWISVVSVTATGNIVTNNSDYGVWGGSPTLDYNDVWNNGEDYRGSATPGPHSISVDPLYCDPLTGDYQLDTLSPCAGMGEEGTDIGAFGVGCQSACLCLCSGDPLCDSLTNVLDVVRAVDVAFRGGPPSEDPYPTCPRNPTDADCDGDTDALDVVRFVNVAFRNADPAVQFCDPCAP